MPEPLRLSYGQTSASQHQAGALPYVPIDLAHNQNTVRVRALVDSGAALNVLPYGIGATLGFEWEEQSTRVKLAGNLAAAKARAILVQGTVGTFPPLLLAFAWTKSDEVPPILGQVNVFMEFDVCFFGSQAALEIRPKSATQV